MNTVDYGLHKCDLGVVPSMDVRLMIEAVTLMLNPKDVKHLDFITSERDYFFKLNLQNGKPIIALNFYVFYNGN